VFKPAEAVLFAIIVLGAIGGISGLITGAIQI
jgi:arginine:ornithine antiporter/lysine permease